MWQRSFRALTTAVDVRVSAPELVAAVEAMTAGYAAAAAPELRYELAGGPPWQLRRDGELIYDSEALIDLAPAFEHDLYRSVITRTGGWPLHAAALDLNGEALLLAGPSGAGKSTMTLALLEGGARYLTDEIAAVDVERRVAGLTRPIAFDDDWAGRVPARFREGESVARDPAGERVRSRIVMPPPALLAHAAPPAGLVVLLRHAPNEPVAMQRLTASEALRRLWDLAWRTDPVSLEIATAFVAAVPVVALSTRSVGDAAAAILDAWQRRG